MELVSFPTTCDDLEFSRREKSEFGWDEKRMGDSAENRERRCKFRQKEPMETNRGPIEGQ